MNVLSLFDGISGGALALQRAGVHVDRYYASEIDKNCIAINQHHWPKTIQLGDVTNWKEWKLPTIDLMLGGFPCQSFSTAGKGLNFDDPRGKLFFTMLDVLKEVKPKYFLFENVKMKKEYQDVISDLLGVSPILINSSLVSAQHRTRLYWTNIPNISQPENKNVLLKDIIEDGFVDRDKSFCIDASYFKGGNLKSYLEKHRRQLVFDSFCLREVRTEEAKRMRREIKKTEGRDFSPRRAKELIPREDGKSGTLTTGLTVECVLVKMLSERSEDLIIRKLTPLECEKLQTLPPNYTNVAGIAKSHRYKAIGNGWTIDVIAHLLKGLLPTV
jgi:DNA-cytosine methyltransferase